MAHGHQPEIGRLLWKGKYKQAVALHLEAFERDPERECVPCASTLYAGRSDARIRALLLEYIETHLYDHALRLNMNVTPDTFMDTVDVVSTIFVWATRQPETDAAQGNNLLNVAAILIYEALSHEAQLSFAPHSPLLIMLTRAEIHFTTGTSEGLASGLADVYEARNRARAIRDPRQRERVLRKAGLLLRAHGQRRAGYVSLIKALLVLHASFGVKAKTIAALLGVER